MKITSVRQQQKREDRYSVFVDGRYRFSLSRDEVADLGLRENQEVGEQELGKLQGDAVLGKAYDRSLRYLEIRPRSEYEIRSYLKRKAYDEEIVNAIVKKLYSLDLLDDAKFARLWVEWRLSSKPSSKRRLSAELRQKRIDLEVVEEILSEVTEDTELAQIKELAARKRRLSQYQDQRKLMAYLSRQGFTYDQIKRALNPSGPASPS